LGAFGEITAWSNGDVVEELLYLARTYVRTSINSMMLGGMLPKRRQRLKQQRKSGLRLSFIAHRRAKLRFNHESER
jgi:hypothetical protein